MKVSDMQVMGRRLASDSMIGGLHRFEMSGEGVKFRDLFDQ